jgi:hypothetical protein
MRSHTHGLIASSQTVPGNLAVARQQKAMSGAILPPTHGREIGWKLYAEPCATHPTQAKNGEQDQHKRQRLGQFASYSYCSPPSFDLGATS